ncbi:MAG: VanW family protein [Acidimicrobiales bacterium]
MARHATQDKPRWRRRLLAGGAPVVVLAALVAGWALDTRGAGAVRNVELAGDPVGNYSPQRVEDAVSDVDAELRGTEVSIRTPEREYTSTAEALGLTVDQEATVEAVLDAGRSGMAPARVLSWLKSFVAEHQVDPVLDVDRAALAGTLATLEGDDRVEPLEPTIEPGPAGLQVRPGTPGSGIDVDELAEALPDAATAAAGEAPITVEISTGPIPPRFTNGDAQAVADQANALSVQPLAVALDGQTSQVSQPTIQSWMRAIPGEAGLTLQLDEPAVLASIAALFPSVGQEAQSATFDIVEGRPSVIPGQDGTACCAPDTGARAFEALQAGTGRVDVDLVVTPPELTTDEANALGIVEEVGQPDAFGPTTRHACCQSRVENIHRIADTIRGHVILPGETFSVNGFVGPRTREKGYVSAPVIYEGESRTDIGGGVSQFATTIFNAALFAGLDFGEYQSHSLVIDRYPRGHEATISYPHPDLEIVNNSPYGVLLWPTYTESSITVHVYSTHHVDVELGEASSSRQGNCTRVTTPRTRRYADGSVEEDSVFGVYRPGEGVNC